MAKGSKGDTASEVKTSSVSISEFIKSPAAAYAKMQSGERLVLTGKDEATRIVMYPGTLADYGSDE